MLRTEYFKMQDTGVAGLATMFHIEPSPTQTMALNAKFNKRIFYKYSIMFNKNLEMHNWTLL